MTNLVNRSVGTRRGIRAARAALWYAIAIAVAAFFLFPLYWSIISSLKAPAEAISSDVTYWPKQFSIESYLQIADRGAGGIFSALGNSLIVTLLTIAIAGVVSTLAGYAFSRFRFPGSPVLFVLILLVLMIPFQSILIPLYVLLTGIGLSNSLLGLALLYATFQLPFSIFVMRNTFDQVPRELDEAATVDGAGTLRTLVSVLLPTTWPGVVTVVLFAFLFAWNEFLAALVILGDPTRFTIPVMLNLIVANQYGTVVWGDLQAGVVVAMVPCLLVFLLLQRYYVAGATAGSLKG
jgi:multiple sugar transport system permease protein